MLVKRSMIRVFFLSSSGKGINHVALLPLMGLLCLTRMRNKRTRSTAEKVIQGGTEVLRARWTFIIMNATLTPLGLFQWLRGEMRYRAHILDNTLQTLRSLHSLIGARSGAVDWSTALQAGSSRVRLPDGVIGFFNWYNPSGRTMALELTQTLTEISTRNVSLGYRRPVRRADITTFMCRLSWNLGVSASWNL